MKKLILFFLLLPILSCQEAKEPLSAQQIIDKSIEASGGINYKEAQVSFEFRDKKYASTNTAGTVVMERISNMDSVVIRDVKEKNDFKRFINDSLIAVPDSLARRYMNSINSVHYFSRLPYGLNDGAVKKELLEEVIIKGTPYYKVKVTFDQQGGGDDFEDIYLYWFNQETFLPDFLAYEFHVDGGGVRFRRAYNERFISGIRFVDYENYKGSPKAFDFFKIDSVFAASGLELLSKIELEHIGVNRPD